MALEFLRPILGVVDPSLIVYGAFFLIFFMALFFSFSKVFKDQYGNPNKTIATIISLCISLLIIYYGEDFIRRLIYSINISPSIINWILAGVFTIFIIYIIKKYGFRMLSIVLGSGLIIVSITELVYRKEIVLILGAFLVMLGIYLIKKKKEKDKLKNMDPLQREKYLALIRDKEERKRNKNYETGRKIGRSMGKTYYGK